jgi:cold-inducible RNA-binding protein
MNSKLFIGNLPYSLTDDKLAAIFAPHGTVVSATVLTDRETGRSKGFGFVEMSSEEEAQAAIKACDQMEVEGRNIKVDIARPPREKNY